MATISNMQRILIACVLIISGCASNTLIPVAAECPKFPTPPKALMQSPPTAYLLQQTQQKQP